MTAVGGNSPIPIVSKEALQASSGGILGIEGLTGCRQMGTGTTTVRLRGSKSKVK